MLATDVPQVSRQHCVMQDYCNTLSFSFFESQNPDSQLTWWLSWTGCREDSLLASQSISCLLVDIKLHVSPGGLEVFH